MKPQNKIIPVFQTDAQMDAFLETADLSEYDLSGFTPVVFRMSGDFDDFVLHLPPQTWKRIQDRSESLHISKEALINQWIDAGLR